MTKLERVKELKKIRDDAQIAMCEASDAASEAMSYLHYSDDQYQEELKRIGHENINTEK